MLRKRASFYWLLFYLPLCCLAPGRAVAQAPAVEASITANGTKFTELSPRIMFTFTLTNKGGAPVPVDELASRIELNGKTVWQWKPGKIGNVNPDKLDPGETYVVDSIGQELTKPIRRPGVYVVKWSAPAFKEQLFTLRVLPDHPQADEPLTTTFLRSLRARLPKGWDAEYEKEAGLFKVERLTTVLMQPRSVPNDNPINKRIDTMQQFFLWFWVEPRVTPANYEATKAENERIRAEMHAMQKNMLHIDHKFDHYMPGTPEEKAQVDAYNQLKEKVVYLPTHHFGDLSLHWGTAMGMGGEYEALSVVNTEPRRECESVVEELQKLLTRYEPET